MNTGGYTPADLQNMGFFFDADNAFKPAPTLTDSEPRGRDVPAEPNLNTTQ